MAKGYRKLGWLSAQRKSILRNQATDLLIHERVETTLTRAKELQRYTEKVITLGKKGDLHARRQAASKLRHVTANAETGEQVLQKLFGEIATRYESRNGGYTRILKIDNRRGDNAPMAIIELVK